MLFTNFCGNKWKDGEFSWMGEADVFAFLKFAKHQSRLLSLQERFIRLQIVLVSIVIICFIKVINYLCF